MPKPSSSLSYGTGTSGARGGGNRSYPISINGVNGGTSTMQPGVYSSGYNYGYSCANNNQINCSIASNNID